MAWCDCRLLSGGRRWCTRCYSSSAHVVQSRRRSVRFDFAILNFEAIKSMTQIIALADVNGYTHGDRNIWQNDALTVSCLNRWITIQANISNALIIKNPSKTIQCAYLLAFDNNDQQNRVNVPTIELLYVPILNACYVEITCGQTAVNPPLNDKKLNARWCNCRKLTRPNVNIIPVTNCWENVTD